LDKKLNILRLAMVVTAAMGLGIALKIAFKGDWFEFAGFVTGIVGVYLVSIENIWNWPVGLTNVSIYAWVFFASKLYADMSLQFFFFALGVYGWYHWLRGGLGATELKISRIPEIWWVYIVCIWASGAAVYIPIIRYLGGAAPVIDSILTVGSILAQLLLNAKKIENWILWIVVDVVYIYLFIDRNLKSTAVLYFIMLLLAISGLITWIKTYRLENQQTLKLS